MKILYIHQYFNTPEMPGSTRSYEFALRLAKEGNLVYMVTSNWQNQTFSINVKNLKVFSSPIKYSNKMNKVQKLFSFFSFSIFTLFTARKLKFDLIFATSTPLTVGIPALIYKRCRNVKLIFEVRDLWPQLPIAMGFIKSNFLIKIIKKFERKIYEESNKIIALSIGIKSEISNIISNNDKIEVIANMSDINLFNIKRNVGTKFKKNTLKIKDEPLIVYTGAFGRINNANYLVEIAKESKKKGRNYKFLLAGNGYQKKEIIENAIESQLLNYNLYVFDYFKKNQVPEIMSAATIATSLFIDLPEMRNNSANKFFDGLAAGKPIMINYGGWQSDLLIESGAGFVVSNYNYKKAFSVIDSIISEKNQLNKMSKASKLLADKFSVDSSCNKLIKIVKELDE